MVTSVSQRGRNNYSEQAADRIVMAARRAMADFLNVEADAVVFGRSATQINFDMARAIGRALVPGDEIVVSRLDHDANIRPWVIAAEANDLTVRWIDFDKRSGELRPEHVREALSERSRLVAVTGASNFLGTKPDIPAIAAEAHRVGAELYLDAVAYAAHELVDFAQLGVDYVVCSPYKFCGPHLGVLGSTVERLSGLVPDKLRPSTMRVPNRFELGTLPYEALAGVAETVEFLADLTVGPGSRRERLERSYRALAAHESALFDELLKGIEQTAGVRRIGSPGSCVPTVLFAVDGRTPEQTCRELGARDVAVMGGSFYAIEAAEFAGLGEGGVRAGIAPYTNAEDVARLLEAVADLSPSSVARS